MDNYWQYSGGVTIDEARAIAKAHDFDLELGRVSRFDNARGVVIGRADLQASLINKLLLAEEIQHGLDRPTGEASRAILRGLSVAEFHAELSRRIVQGHERGHFQFLSADDRKAIQGLIKELWQRRK